jgi:hypothetical protein
MTIAITLAIIVRVLLAFVFLRAAWHKGRSLPHFQAQMGAYQLLPDAVLPFVARLFLLLEIAVALTLPMWAWSTPPFIAGGLLAIYTGALVISLRRGMENLDCGCGGESAQAITWALVLRNGFLIVLALVAMLPTAQRGVSPLELAIVVPACIAVILVYCSVELAIANEQRQRRHIELRRGTRA